MKRVEWVRAEEQTEQYSAERTLKFRMHDYTVHKVSMLLVSRTGPRRRQCFFCGEKAVIDAHHRIPQSITKRIPRLVRAEVLDDIFGKDSQRRYPLCKNCHRKLHSVLSPFEKSVLLFSDIRSPEKRIVEQMMKDKILAIVGRDGKEDVADIERVLSKLERRGVSTEESVRLLKELRNDGPIYFVMPDEPSAGYQDPSLINKITYDYDSVVKARRKLRRY